MRSASVTAGEGNRSLGRFRETAWLGALWLIVEGLAMGRLIFCRIGLLMESAHGKALSFILRLMMLSVAEHWVAAA